MQQIQANVSKDILKKADRLFAGTKSGRISEMLQNARRAGASTVIITNKDGWVTIKDDGRGISDFQKLLELGSCGWNEDIVTGEDAAGVGFFSIMPREVIVQSGRTRARIHGDGWTGEPVPIIDIEESIKGTVVMFKDDPWDLYDVEAQARYSGLHVIVDGDICDKKAFVSRKAVEYPELGIHVEVTEDAPEGRCFNNYYCHGYTGLYVNYHGVVLGMDITGKMYKEEKRHVRVEISDTSKIRLLLPARTKLVEDEAYEQMEEIAYVEFFKSFLGQEHHLSFELYEKAVGLGVQISEAVPEIKPLNPSDSGFDPWVDDIECKDEEFQEAKKYLIKDHDNEDEINSYIFRMHGTDHQGFLPVEIKSRYKGYSWADLPVVEKIIVEKTKEITSYLLHFGNIILYESLKMTIHTSDEATYTTQVPIAVFNDDTTAYVTWEAEAEVEEGLLMLCLGGYSDDGDTWETQEYYFEENLREFWNSLRGEYENLKLKVLDGIKHNMPCSKNWSKIVINKDETVEIILEDGTVETA